MNKIIFLFSIVSISLFSCKKKTEIDPMILQCSNGIRDGVEDGVDCGQQCYPCLLSHPDGWEQLMDNHFGNESFPDSSVTQEVVDGKLVITALHEDTGIYLKITFDRAEPEVFKEYYFSDAPTEYSVRMEYFAWSYIAIAQTYALHLNREGGKYTVEFTDLSMLINSSTSYIDNIDGKLKCFN